MNKTAFVIATLLLLFWVTACKKNENEQGNTFIFATLNVRTCKLTFSNQVPNASQYEWDFGDGTAKSTEPNPVHTYACPGDYLVTLTVIINGTSSSESQKITVASETFAVKYSASPSTVIPTSDMGYAIFGSILSGQQTVFYFIKADCSGTRIFEKIYSETEINYASSMVQTKDGGYLLLGNKKGSGSDNNNVYIMKIDSSGNKQWENNFGINREYPEAVQQTPDEGYVVFGSTADLISGDFNFYLAKTDKLGQVEWEKTYGGPKNESGHSISISKDGGYAMLGHIDELGEAGFDTYLVKTNSIGNQEWEKNYGDIYEDSGRDIISTTDGGYALFGYTQNKMAPNYDMHLIKTNQNGEAQWMKSFDNQGGELGFSVKQTTDSGYILLGLSSGTGTQDSDCFLIKTDKTGVSEWTKIYGEPGSDAGLSVAQISDCDGYIMLCVFSNIMNLIKTDKNGGIQ